MREFPIKYVINYGKRLLIKRSRLYKKHLDNDMITSIVEEAEQIEIAALITLLEQVEAAGTITTIVVEVGEEVANV